MLRATKVRLYPSPEQAKFLIAQFGAVRFVYNKALYLFFNSKSNSRVDFQHKLSKTIIDESQAVIVETLKSTNLMKNRRLAKHLAEDEALSPRSGL